MKVSNKNSAVSNQNSVQFFLPKQNYFSLLYWFCSEDNSGTHFILIHKCTHIHLQKKINMWNKLKILKNTCSSHYHSGEVLATSLLFILFLVTHIIKATNKLANKFSTFFAVELKWKRIFFVRIAKRKTSAKKMRIFFWSLINVFLRIFSCRP